MYHLVKSLYLHATSLPEYSVLLLGLDAAGKTTLLNQIKAIYNNPSHPHSSSGGGSGTFSSLLTSTSTIAGSGPGSAQTPATATPHTPSTSYNPFSSAFSLHRASSYEDGEESGVGRTVPTVGQNVATIRLDDCYLKIWDVGGQQSLRGLWPSYYRSCHAIVFVVDSTDVGEGDLLEVAGRISGSSSAGIPADGGVFTTEERGFSRKGHAQVQDDDDDAEGRLRECAAVLTGVLSHADAEGVPLLVLANKQDREDSVEVVRIKEGFVRKVVEGKQGGQVRDSRVLPCSALKGTGVREAVEWVRSRVKWNREVRAGVMR